MKSKITGFKAFCNKTSSYATNPIHANEATEPHEKPSTQPTDKPVAVKPKSI